MRRDIGDERLIDGFTNAIGRKGDGGGVLRPPRDTRRCPHSQKKIFSSSHRVQSQDQLVMGPIITHDRDRPVNTARPGFYSR